MDFVIKLTKDMSYDEEFMEFLEEKYSFANINSKLIRSLTRELKNHYHKDFYCTVTDRIEFHPVMRNIA